MSDRCQVCGEPFAPGDWWRGGQIGPDDRSYVACSHQPEPMLLADDQEDTITPETDREIECYEQGYRYGKFGELPVGGSITPADQEDTDASNDAQIYTQADLDHAYDRGKMDALPHVPTYCPECGGEGRIAYGCLCGTWWEDFDAERHLPHKAADQEDTDA